ncbi:MAG TPA: tRNA (adenosine(37)-N6)-threonylcarbamoyltransferase complex ATPase subunit type 1 TsaE [Acidimicrobiia bacterium]|jgi:tRNA threonylcarbamoyladenosine biosynthesis protein TsaE
MEICSRAAEETLAVGACVAGVLRGGDVVVLSGELGAGKTVFAKGVAQGLGVVEPVVSPTFTIVREYEGRLPLKHVDVYRLDHLQELIDIGLEELLDDRSVMLVEWGEAVGAVLPEERLEVRLDLLPPEEAGDEARVITLVGSGMSWRDRVEDLGSLIAGRGW